MTIKTKLTKTDFINLNFVLLFSKVFIRIVFIIMTLSLVFGIVSAIIPNTFAGDFSVSRILTPLFVLAFLPAVTYFTSAKNYLSNKRISETIEYKFEKDYLVIKGESFNSQLTWDKIHKVTLTKNWLLIFQTKQSANAINRTDIWDGEIDEFKEILIEHRVKNNFS